MWNLHTLSGFCQYSHLHAFGPPQSKSRTFGDSRSECVLVCLSEISRMQACLLAVTTAVTVSLYAQTLILLAYLQLQVSGTGNPVVEAQNQYASNQGTNQ